MHAQILTQMRYVLAQRQKLVNAQLTRKLEGMGIEVHDRGGLLPADLEQDMP
jgi:hypothetical protein